MTSLALRYLLDEYHIHPFHPHNNTETTKFNSLVPFVIIIGRIDILLWNVDAPRNNTMYEWMLVYIFTDCYSPSPALT